MDLSSILHHFRNMGPAYWAAAAAIALGFTLVTTAGVLQWRRLRATRRQPARRAHMPATAVAGYAAQAVTPPAPAMVADPDLTERLAVAASRLEAVHAAMAALEQLPAGSPLKPTPSHVEYVFRSGTA
ncbi:hypothetical protein DRQ50_15060 [bacterium]|nr:MAG: hypothetical protein DRQ50_15060 [bacterium]